MSKKSKLLAVLIVMALIPATASATVTRVQGLGGWPGAAYVVKDASNPVQFPSTLVYYSHLLYAEFSVFDPDKFLVDTLEGGIIRIRNKPSILDRVGAWYGFGEGASVVGFDIFHRGKPEYHGMPDISGDESLPYRLNVRWAKPFNGFILGAALSLFHESHVEGKYDSALTGTYVDSDLEQKSTVIGLKLGATALDNLLDVALGFEFPSWTNKDRLGNTDTENDGSSHIDFAARYWYHYAEKATLIPHVEVVMHKEAYSTPGDQGESGTNTTVRLGVGHNWKPVKAVLVVWEMGVRFSSTKYESEARGIPHYTNNWTDLPYWRVGWEGRVYKWLKVRAGAEKTWLNEKLEFDVDDLEPDPLEPQNGRTITKMYFGGDFNFGPVVIQYLLDHDFLRRGPYFISGSSGSIFHRFSMFYKIPK